MKSKKNKIKKISITPIFLLAFLLIVSVTIAQRISSATYVIPRESIDSGGGNFTSADYFLEASIEQIGGNSSSANYAVCIGLNCCPADVIASFINTSVDTAGSTATISFALWHSDLCMGTTNVTVQCAANCNPCSEACTVSETRHTLALPDILVARNTMSVDNPNPGNIIYCKVTDDTFSLERCFTSANLTVTVEAGGPYTGTSAVVLVAGNVSYSDGTRIPGANVTIDIFKTSDLSNRLGRVSVNSSSNGKYFATFGNLEIDVYRVNVTARYQSLMANNTDIFDIVGIQTNCQIKTISLSGIALDATTGLKIPSGVASLTIEETGDRKDAAVSNGAWSSDMVTCVVSEKAYTLTVMVTDNQGKVSWSELKFKAP
jgi:hypothetical protein